MHGEIGQRISTLKIEIGKAKGRLRATGRYADRSWYHQANDELKSLGAYFQRVCHRLGELRRQRARKSQQETERARKEFPQRFLTAAKKMLDDETFDQICEFARLPD